MSTRNIVPRANGEGGLGTEDKHWGELYTEKAKVGDKTVVTCVDDAYADAEGKVTTPIASQTEAEAQSKQNNTKKMTPLRVYQAIVAYFTQFLAAAVFTGIVKAVAPAAASNDNSVPTTSWVRTCFESMAKTVAEILEIQWKAEATGYLLLGPYLGNLKILWGGSDINTTQEVFINLPVTGNTDLIRIAVSVNSSSAAQQVVIKQKNATNFSYVSNVPSGALLYIIITY